MTPQRIYGSLTQAGHVELHLHSNESMTLKRIHVKLTQAGHVELHLHPERPSTTRRAGPSVGAAQRQPQELGGLR